MNSSNNSSVHKMNKTHAVTLRIVGAVKVLSLQFSARARARTHEHLTTALYHALTSVVAIFR